MTILKFDGVVDEIWIPGLSYAIGGRDVISEVEAVDWAGPVTVALAGESFTGDLHSWEGSKSYGEYSPGDPAELEVGDHNVFSRLDGMVGEVVTLWIADEPVNTLDPPPARG